MSDLTPAPHRPQPPGDPAFAEPARETRAPFPAAPPANPPPIDPCDPVDEDPRYEPPPDEPPAGPPRLQHPARGRRCIRKDQPPASPIPPLQGLLRRHAWRRSGLPAGDFAPLVGISKHTLYSWHRKFQKEGPAGLEDRPRGAPTGSRLPEVTRRAILMMKETNPDWGVEKISALLLRGPALPASPQAVARVLHEAGFETGSPPPTSHLLLRRLPVRRCRIGGAVPVRTGAVPGAQGGLLRTAS